MHGTALKSTDQIIPDNDVKETITQWKTRQQHIPSLADCWIVAETPPAEWQPTDRAIALAIAHPNRPFLRIENKLQSPRPENVLVNLRSEIIHLSRLEPDWAGEDSAVPNLKVINDLQRVLYALPADLTVPNIEIDDQGGVSLEWTRDDGQARFALYCLGTGDVVGTYVTLRVEDQLSWREKVSKNIELALKLSDPMILDLMTGV